MRRGCTVDPWVAAITVRGSDRRPPWSSASTTIDPIPRSEATRPRLAPRANLRPNVPVGRQTPRDFGPFTPARSAGSSSTVGKEFHVKQRAPNNTGQSHPPRWERRREQVHRTAAPGSNRSLMDESESMNTRGTSSGRRPHDSVRRGFRPVEITASNRAPSIQTWGMTGLRPSPRRPPPAGFLPNEGALGSWYSLEF